MPVLISHYLPRRVTCTMAFEVGISILCFAALAAYLDVIQFAREERMIEPLVMITFACPVMAQAGFVLFGLYSRRSIYSGRNVAPRMVGATVTLAMILFPLLLITSHRTGLDLALMSHMCAVAMSIFVVVAAGARLVVLRLFNNGAHAGRVLLIGDADCLGQVIAEVRRAHGSSIRLAGILGRHESGMGDDISGVPVLGGLDRISETVRQQRIRTILLSLPAGHPDLPLDELIQCRLAGVDVVDCASFYERVCHKLLIEREETLASLAFGCSRMTRFRWCAKSATDKVAALALLTVFAVPMTIVALLVHLTSSGPVIYRQERVGRFGRTFTLLKFRTMTVDAEAGAGATWAQRNDPRATPLGRLLRRSRFDELPQLINILRGDMAFVGPRPERPEFVSELDEKIRPYHFRHLVKPGLTGWAQVSFGYAASVDATREKLRYDLYYLKNMSLVFDLVIVAATARAVIVGRGIV